jgi:Rhodopirellula transposase DDE domain
MTEAERLQSKYAALGPVLDERQCRLWAAAEARALGRGGVTLVARATGITRKRIHRGLRELDVLAGTTPPTAKPRPGRVRRPGGGRCRLAAKDPELVRELEALVEPSTRGDPMSPLRWTCKSTENLAAELRRRGHPVSARTVAGLLKELGYSLQGLRKTKEGTAHPDRNAQFEYLNAQVGAFQERGQPVISVDTKKKELVGDFKNGGREWQPQGQPEPVRVHDFLDAALGKAIPYGVYDPKHNSGWVSVGTDHDTAAFAVQSIRTWWQQMGQRSYPDAAALLITADGGGSNSSRCRLWKTQLQRLADETGLAVTVCHFPPGTSKWNQIEHRMFCHITQNWRSRPLISHEAVIQLIGSTTTHTGLTIRAGLDTGQYPTGTKVADDELAALQIKRADFHGDWNYTVSPRHQSAIG